MFVFRELVGLPACERNVPSGVWGFGSGRRFGSSLISSPLPRSIGHAAAGDLIDNYNYNPRSRRLNRELLVRDRDPALFAALAPRFEEIAQECRAWRMSASA